MSPGKMHRFKSVAPSEDGNIYVKMGDIPFDIMRFNISARSGAERRETRKALLLRMGAVPPKKEYINYKLLMNKQKEQNAKMHQFPRDAAFAAVNKRVPVKKRKNRGKKGKKKNVHFPEIVNHSGKSLLGNQK
ncbi:hypothetical protein EG68_01348 [Paragonimus skrjabini miyazakii]|uniref:Uncharacterized protein n=1 Tax=Paragonimus skrjabini miyazakii TaxID=59628 RepID=A0A8S9Z6A2_9TREM|nr:hypothetical protein EG68_01348 [Paragonimus skrjabini miyazakii]